MILWYKESGQIDHYLSYNFGTKKYDGRKNIATKMHVLNVSDHQFQAKECGIKEGFVDIRRYAVVEYFK